MTNEKITAKELREKFLNFFQSKNHTIISSSSLIPDNDPTVLFITAGMQPLVPYLLGQDHPGGKRLANVQKCWRTGDIEEVGDTYHHTFFEMLGNWSLGDYDRLTAIDYAWEFVTKILQLDKSRLAVSVFGGNTDLPDYDKEAEDKWLSLGLSRERIAHLADNWWGPAGQVGPCGPDTEIFYWSSTEPVPEAFDPNDSRWVEIWNNVFMEYNKTINGSFEPLLQKNIDTGMGLERTTAALNNLNDNYLTDLFQPIISELERISNKKYTDNPKAFRIIADHLRSATFLLGDPLGISPANTGQGYVLRRVIRRAIRFAKELGITNSFTTQLATVVIKMFKDVYPELEQNQKFIIDELVKEEAQFRKTLEKGLRIFEQKHNQAISGKDAFDLYQTYGFPIEVIIEETVKRGLEFSEKEKQEFEIELKKHQELSRTAAAGMFKGGLADHGEMSIKYHTATHLLNQSLRTILGNHVEQRGSNINTERLRFDFSHPDKMTAEQIKQVEDLVNEKIKEALPVSSQEMTVDEAKAAGALGVFTHKYGEKVKVYSVGDFSKEICGGPHVSNTSELGHFKILKEESSSSGIRRIKAVLE